MVPNLVFPMDWSPRPTLWRTRAFFKTVAAYVDFLKNFMTRRVTAMTCLSSVFSVLHQCMTWILTSLKCAIATMSPIKLLAAWHGSGMFNRHGYSFCASRRQPLVFPVSSEQMELKRSGPIWTITYNGRRNLTVSIQTKTPQEIN